VTVETRREDELVLLVFVVAVVWGGSNAFLPKGVSAATGSSVGVWEPMKVVLPLLSTLLLGICTIIVVDSGFVEVVDAATSRLLFVVELEVELYRLDETETEDDEEEEAKI
jgi:hypothetical protein